MEACVPVSDSETDEVFWFPLADLQATSVREALSPGGAPQSYLHALARSPRHSSHNVTSTQTSPSIHTDFTFTNP